MKNIVLKPFWTAIFMAATLISGAHAGASPAASVKKNTKTGVSGQVRFLPGSAETSKERSSRLKRECQGKVNAGACAGYTR